MKQKNTQSGVPAYLIPNDQVSAGIVKSRNFIENILPKTTVDEKLAQRIFVDWLPQNKQSYVASLLRGTNLTSVFVLADINSILLKIEGEIQSCEDTASDGYLALVENKEYFKSLVDAGFSYLLLDGKHRSEVLLEVFSKKNFKFTDDVFETIMKTFNVKGNPVDLNAKGKTAKELFSTYADLQDYLMDSTGVLVCMIKDGDIKQMQQIFINTNSGLKLFPMELRICTMSSVARYVRELTDPIENPLINQFFNQLEALSGTGEKSIKKKGDLLLTSLIMAYYFNKIKDNSKPIRDFYSSDYLDAMYSVDFSISASDKNIIRKTFRILAKGALEEYKKSKKPKKVGLKWGETQNLALIILHLILGKTSELKADSRRVDVVNGKEKEFFRELFDAQQKLLASNLYELDSKGNTIPRLDKYGNPVQHTKGKFKGTPMWIENEHSFKRKNLNNTPENQYDKLVMFDEYIRETNLLETLEDAGVIVLVESTRTLSKEEKRFQAIVQQNSIDAFTGKFLELGEIESGLTANSHVEAHSKGGSDMVVGNAKANLKSKTDTLYNAI